MFRLLKVRPPNGWNAVAWELVIVTLGVLLALGAQQMAETVNQRFGLAFETIAGVVRQDTSNH